jgi:hypothetical protein
VRLSGLPELLANFALSAADPEGSVGGVEKNLWSFWLSSKVCASVTEKAAMAFSGTAQGVTRQREGAADGALEVEAWAWRIEEAEEADAGDAGLPPALTATCKGEAKEAAPAGRSVAQSGKVTADRLTLRVRRNNAARKESAATEVASVVATVAAEAAAARYGLGESSGERVPAVDVKRLAARRREA